MKDDLRIAAAEAEVERRRAQLVGTLNDGAALLQPKKIIGDVWESAKNKGADLAEDAVDAVTRRPVLVGGVLAAIAAYLARDPIKDAASKAYGAMTSAKTKKGKSKTTHASTGTAPAKSPSQSPRRHAPTRRAPKSEKIA